MWNKPEGMADTYMPFLASLIGDAYDIVKSSTPALAPHSHVFRNVSFAKTFESS